MERNKSGPICILRIIFFIKLEADTEIAPNPDLLKESINSALIPHTCMH